MEAGQARAREAASASVAALQTQVAARAHHDPKRLVVPDRHARADALDEARERLRLGLGRGAGPGVVGSTGSPAPASDEGSCG